jgi:FKBP-type peptidyl-prolyl cis-trans isomerase
VIHVTIYNQTMRKQVYLILLGSLALQAQAQDAQIKSRIDSVSYLAGQNIAQSILKDFPEANVNLLVQGLSDALLQRPSVLQDPDNKCVMTYFQEKMGAIQQAEQAVDQEALAKEIEAARINREKGEAFLLENAKKDGIKVTASGLQYEVIKKGRGEHPTASSTVKVHYTGTTINGEIFDSSVERNEPISFPLNAVIPGWTEGVQLMNVGAKYRFYIPQELAYGQNSPTALIPPYSVLIFEVQLLEIEK